MKDNLSNLLILLRILFNSIRSFISQYCNEYRYDRLSLALHVNPFNNGINTENLPCAPSLQTPPSIPKETHQSVLPLHVWEYLWKSVFQSLICVWSLLSSQLYICDKEKVYYHYTAFTLRKGQRNERPSIIFTHSTVKWREHWIVKEWNCQKDFPELRDHVKLQPFPWW